MGRCISPRSQNGDDQPASNHFAVEVADWDNMLAHLDQEDAPYGRFDRSFG